MGRAMATCDECITLMSYNVHRMIGSDRHRSAARIAQVIASYHPDIIALQELPGSRYRPVGPDPANDLLNELSKLGPEEAFLLMERERNGNVVLSRLPMRLIRAGGLYPERRRISIALRGALWVEIEAFGRRIQLINTHLGVTPPERVSQVKVLTGPDWLGHPDCRPPMILCGDFNVVPGSAVHTRLKGSLKDIQAGLALGRHERTFPSRYPMLRLDHLFASPDLAIEAVRIPRTDLARTASDHLPLLVTLRLTSSASVSPLQ